MARRTRIEFPGAIYHALDRGDRRESIDGDDDDRRAFLKSLGEACQRTGWRIHAYALMSNHYHLMLETPEPNLVAGMHWFQAAWSSDCGINRRRRLRGHILQGRYKAVVVDPSASSYFAALSDYIHLNSVRAGIVGLPDRLFEYEETGGRL
jgi:putative transposase